MKVRINDVVVTVRDDVQIVDGQTLHRGLTWDVRIEAADERTALGSAEGYVNWTANLLCLVSDTAIDSPKALWAIDIDETASDRTLAQMLWDAPTVQAPKRRVAREAWLEVWKRLDDLRGKNAETAKRIDRALHYYRKSAVEPDPIDEFEDLCNGLQSLDPAIRRMVGLPGSVVANCQSGKCSKELRCDECKHPQTRPNTFGGTTHVITEVLGEKASADMAWRDTPAGKLVSTRNDLVHGNRPVDQIAADLPTLVPLARLALHAGVNLLLGSTPEEAPRGIRELLKVAGPTPALGVVRLHDLAARNLLAAPRFPQVRLHRITTVTSAPVPPATDRVLRAVQIHVSIDDFDGKWTPLGAGVILPFDPEAADSEVEVRLLPP